MELEEPAYVKVLRCGAFGSVQDMGRKGHRHFGIPLSGFLDEKAAKMANLLAGNAEDVAVLELFGPGWEFEFSHDTIIALSGADWSPEINQKPIPLNQSFQIKARSVLTLKQAGPGRIAYLSLHGGILSPEILGSRSWHPYLTDDFMLKKNMLLPYASIEEKSLESQIRSIKLNNKNSETSITSAKPGPEWHLLSENSIHQLIEREWTFSSGSNRMAYIVAENLSADTESILTSAVWPGIVQLTPSGHMMILMKDAQTTGGYPRILSIAQNELNKIAQKNPGEKFKWKIEGIDGRLIGLM